MGASAKVEANLAPVDYVWLVVLAVVCIMVLRRIAKASPTLRTSYFCLIFGGGFGLHHFYLGNDARAFLYCATFGGCFGIALVEDLFQLPNYVGILEKQDIYEGFNKFNTGWIRSYLCGRYFAAALSVFNPNLFLDPSNPQGFKNRLLLTVPSILGYVSAAVGVWLITAAGLSANQYRGWKRQTFVSMALISVGIGFGTLLIFNFILGQEANGWDLTAAIVACIYLADRLVPVHQALQNDDIDDPIEQQPTSCCCRFLKVYFFAVPLFAACFILALMSNVEVETETGPLKLDELFVNIWNSEIFEDVWNELGQIIRCFQEHGYDSEICHELLQDRADFDGECEAYVGPGDCRDVFVFH